MRDETPHALALVYPLVPHHASSPTPYDHSHNKQVPSPGLLVGAASPARLVNRNSSAARGHVKAAADERSEGAAPEGRGLDGEGSAARVTKSQAGTTAYSRR